jgi:RHS repeat-associated protein
LTYDASGLITSVIAPDGGVMSSATYDANGNTITVLTPGGGVSHFTYDSSGRPLTRIDAAGNTISYAYDSTGRATSITDPGGKSTNFQYDAANQPTVVTDPLGNTVHFTYDAAGNTIGITDQRGISETFTYNSFGNVTSATDPLGATATVSYDLAGHVTAVRDRAGNQINYTHDADGRLTRIDYPGGEFIAFTFDGFGRPTTVANSGSSINDSYDAAGELVTTTTNAPAVGSVSLTYTYDAAGNRLTATGPDGTASYAYDSRGRLTKVTDPKGGMFGLQYDSASKLTNLTRPNGIADSYSYDANGRLVGIASTLGATTVQSLTQTFDVNGQVASRTDSAGTTTYTHDANGRLVAVSGSASQTYAYDAAGNRTAGPISTTSTYNAADELTSDTNFTYTYDAEGQRTSKVDRVTGAITRYAHNGAGQLTSIQNPDGTTTTFKYDPLGRRLAVSAGTSTTAYVYDGADARLEYASGALVASYVGAGNVDRPLEMTRGGNSYYYLQNFQGSVTDLTDSSGSVAASYSYDAFGVPTSAPPAVTNPFTYTGREYDAKSGLYYNRARYYEPTTGSFLSQDPIRTGQPYAYAGGDPADFSDPSGAGPTFEFAAIWKFVTTKLLPAFKTVVCWLAAAGAVIEVGLNLATNVAPSVESIGAILIGVTAACIFGSFKLAATSIWSWLLFPIIAAVVAVIADFLFQLECSARTGKAVSTQHAAFVGASALLIGIGVALLGTPIPEGGGAAALAAAAGVTLVGSSFSAFADVLNTGGACYREP